MQKNISLEMLKFLSKIILTKILGWKLNGLLPNDKKYIIAVVPHTKSFDLIIAILIRSYLGLKIKFIGKKELFNPFTSFLLKSIGGIPVDRSIKNNFVKSVVKLFESNIINILAIAPEGTRKFVKNWKSGFYYIAVGAKIPIVMVSFDYIKKEVNINDKFFPSGSYDNDIKKLDDLVMDVVVRNKN